MWNRKDRRYFYLGKYVQTVQNKDAKNRQITKKQSGRSKKTWRSEGSYVGGVFVFLKFRGGTVKDICIQHSLVGVYSFYINVINTELWAVQKYLGLHAEYRCMHVFLTSELETPSPPTSTPSQQDLKKHLFSLEWSFYTKTLHRSLSTKDL